MKRPYSCEIDISFPTAISAQQAKEVLQVDTELVDTVVKTFSLIRHSEATSDALDCPILNHSSDSSIIEEYTVLRV